MKYLLDTCLLSEAVLPRPNAGVVRWLQAINETDTATSFLVVGEIQRGIRKLAEGEKKARLSAWIQNEFLLRFRNRILDFGLSDSIAWGDMVARLELTGSPRPVVDTMLAATCVTRGLILVTRNEADFRGTGAEVLNPWS